MGYSLSEINQMDRAAFTSTLGHLFERTPTIAASAWPQRPFASKAALHGALVDIMRSLPPSQQLALIGAHPDLGSRAKMADASVQEQASVGLDQLTPEEFDAMKQLNQCYRDKFGFPFIIAVKHHTKTSILAALQQRLQNAPEAEQAAALNQIAEIARLRLDDLVSLP
ncbi:MAG: 2-oxo-4-hydroxy-4-carboxy-5-ureidoimidazoline decarboxylase [Elainellaceae cyanobacterium]